MYSNLTGYRIYSGSKKDLVLEIANYLNGDLNFKKLNIVSGNPEVLLNGINIKSLNDFFKREDNLIIPDGIGVILMLKVFKKYVTEKIAGVEIMEEVLKILNERSLGAYFLGARSENLELAIDNIRSVYRNVRISGFRNGYFDECEVSNIIQDIRNSKANVLFVAMGSPRQDVFISKCMDALDCSIFMGVGGSFDLYSGKVRRAPNLMINLGLEWLYRVWNDPYRIKRLFSIPKFMLKSTMYHFRGKN